MVTKKLYITPELETINAEVEAYLLDASPLFHEDKENQEIILSDDEWDGLFS